METAEKSMNFKLKYVDPKAGSLTVFCETLNELETKIQQLDEEGVAYEWETIDEQEEKESFYSSCYCAYHQSVGDHE